MSLEGKTVAITRNAADAAEFTRMIRKEKGMPLPLPTIRLVGRGAVSRRFLEEADSYQPHHVVFMSSRAVALLFEDAAGSGILDASRLAVANANVVSVGPKTTAMLASYGIRINAEPAATYSSVGVGEVMSRMDRSGNRVMVPRSGASTPFLKELLEKMGFQVREIHMYDVRPDPGGGPWDEFGRLLQEGRVHGIIFTSASSVRAFFDIMAGAERLVNGTTVVSIGPFTAAELDRKGIRYHTSGTHTVAGSVETIKGLLG